MSKVDEIVEKLKARPKSMTTGAGSLAKQLNCTKEEVHEAKRILRGGKSLKEYLRINGVNSAYVKKIKYWQNFKGEQRFSVDVVPDNKLNIKEFLESLKEYQAPTFELKQEPVQENIAVINLYDAHLDKLSIVGETNKDSSFEENIRVFEETFDQLLTEAMLYNPEFIVFPVGNDFFNTNGHSNATKRGTPQDVSVKHSVAFKEGVRVLRRCIDKAASKTKVMVMTIQGNHDEDPTFYLGEILDVMYENVPHVTVNCSKHQRKYITYGENLLGFAHGDKECRNIANMPLIMAEEKKKEWANTTYREWFMGDRHHKFEYKFMRNKDFVGVSVRFLRSVGTSDKWHYDAGYLGVPKTAELYVYNKTKGPRANHLIHIE